MTRASPGTYSQFLLKELKIAKSDFAIMHIGAGAIQFPRTQRITVHFVLDGKLTIETNQRESELIETGDCVLVLYGYPHVLRSGLGETVKRVNYFGRHHDLESPPSLFYGGRDAKARVISGLLEFVFGPVGISVESIPRIVVLRDFGGPLGGSNSPGSPNGRPQSRYEGQGANGFLHRFAELVVTEAIRTSSRELHLASAPHLDRVHVRQISSALMMLKQSPYRAWSLALLSREVGLSRAMLAKHFRAYVGAPPLRYLARLRLTIAAEMLRGTSTPILEIAIRAGYNSAAAFGRAFKHHMGTTPSVYRHGESRRQPALSMEAARSKVPP